METNRTIGYSKTAHLVLCGLFAAVTAVCSFITIPLGFTPVPINLGTLAVFLTGGILGRRYGTISMTVYVLLGCAGVPVFSGFRGGIGVLAGPTGGYIIGYIAAVFIIGILVEAWCDLAPQARSLNESAGETSGNRPDENHTTGRHAAGRMKLLALYAVAMIAGLIVCYALGTAWFMISTGTPLWASLISCVFPFLPGDALKILAAAILVKKLRPVLLR